jgi:hypothetical protein
MFSLSKLLVLALVIAVVWYGFKVFGRFQMPRGSAGGGGGAKPGGRAPATAEDLVKCPGCGAYVTRSDGCNRPECRQPR